MIGSMIGTRSLGFSQQIPLVFTMEIMCDKGSCHYVCICTFMFLRNTDTDCHAIDANI